MITVITRILCVHIYTSNLTPSYVQHSGSLVVKSEVYFCATFPSNMDHHHAKTREEHEARAPNQSEAQQVMPRPTTFPPHSSFFLITRRDGRISKEAVWTFIVSFSFIIYICIIIFPQETCCLFLCPHVSQNNSVVL